MTVSRRDMLAGSAAALAALGLGAAGASAQAGPHPLERSAWTLAAIDGEPFTTALDRGPPTLNFAGGRLGGSGGCNRLLGAYAVDGARLAIRDMASTLMHCGDARMAIERRIVQRLRAVAEWRIEGETLILTGPAGRLAYAGRPK